MMKKLVTLVFAAILGSGLTVAALWQLGQLDNSKTVKIEHLNTNNMVNGALYSANASGQFIPLNFKEISKNVMEGVVHIRATQTSSGQMVESRNYGQPFHSPFDQFFKDEFFDGFFGPRFHFENPNHQQRGPQLRVGTGSGVIINNEGYIVTNNHVIDNADDIEVTLHDNRKYKAVVVGTDPSTDLALIQIKEKDLPTLKMINSDEVEVGEWVLAVGNPFNLNSTVTAGIVSAKARNINILKEKSAIESFIQTDAAINPGNSGGALVNLQGGLVGINTAIASPTGAYSGYGFAIPSNIVGKVVEDLLKYGVVQRGYLGVLIRDVDGNLAKEKELEITKGVYVDSLLEMSAAREAGIKVGDVILKVNETEVKTSPELQEMIGRHRPGDKIILAIHRDGDDKEITVELKNEDGNSKLVEKESNEVFNILGAEFEDIPKKTAKKLEIEGGAKVKSLFAGKLKKHTDIKEGFIITKAAGKDVRSVKELLAVLEKEKGGVLLEGVYEDYPGEYFYAIGL
ncbi:MAG: serine protease [Crocinitomicaceae bacterium]|nr:serine protease [Crocinitomicaceae bacterium]